MIIFGVGLTAILVIENIVLSYDAFVLIWYTSAWFLSLISVWIGILIGFGVKWLLVSGNNKGNSEDYDF